MSLQPSLLVSLQGNILCHLCKGISTVMSLQSSLLALLRSGFLRSSLPASLKSEFLRSSLPVFLRSEFLRSSILASIWNIFLQCLYGDISTVTSIPSKPEIFLQSIQSKPEISLQRICEFTILSKQVKSEASKSWLLLNESLQLSVTLFYKYIGCYVINQTINNTTWNIKKQSSGYIMFLKRK